jgi:hypothetical protein
MQVDAAGINMKVLQITRGDLEVRYSLAIVIER